MTVVLGISKGVLVKRSAGISVIWLLLSALALGSSNQAGAEDYTFYTLAGQTHESGTNDGTLTTARFHEPYSLAVDNNGNLFVAEPWVHTIRQVSASGAVTTLAGAAGLQGSADGVGSEARFNQPYGVAVDSEGDLYVADAYNHTIRKVTASGVVTTIAGLAGIAGSTDGPISVARFAFPNGVAVDSAGNLYVTESGNETLRKITPGGLVTTLAGLAGVAGWADGAGGVARFYNPHSPAVDAANNVYVADYENSAVRMISPEGVVTTLARGSSPSWDLWWPEALTTDRAGNVFVTDTYNSTIRKVRSGEVLTTIAGLARKRGSADGTGVDARFNYPGGVAVDSEGTLFVADTYNFTIRVGTPACPDLPAIDVPTGAVGQVRQLDTNPQTAIAWQWQLVQKPPGSTASLSNASIRNPTFTPDVPDQYAFQLQATNAVGATCIRKLQFFAVPWWYALKPLIPMNDHTFGFQSNTFGFTLCATGQIVVVETSTNFADWVPLATNTAGSFYFNDPDSTNYPFRFYRATSR